MLAMGIGAAFGWYLLQGFGENLGLTGEIHLTPMFGVMFGHLSARCDLRLLASSKVREPRFSSISESATSVA
jgi:hypothetical protein